MLSLLKKTISCLSSYTSPGADQLVLFLLATNKQLVTVPSPTIYIFSSLELMSLTTVTN